MRYPEGRNFLKSQWDESPLESDQSRGVPIPPIENEYDKTKLIPLPDPLQTQLKSRDILDVLKTRRSRRKFTSESMELDELSFLLWSAQGIRESGKPLRMVPSAGCRHPFETYVYITDKFTDLQSGVYRYIATENALIPIASSEHHINEFSPFIKYWYNFAAALFFVANPYRSEWRYIHHSHKFCALDAGHIAQNGYLAAEALGIGCCAIGAYPQKTIDDMLCVDGDNEFTCYIEVFGKVER